ncbi:MAG: oligosaccharide flippase family protein [Deltaproteobacteria bacterium]|nr:oligosaccharide flippase family protein [Deltaproteobacteria bacterium]
MKLATGSALAQGLGIVVAPLVARMFMPASFGTAALFGSIVGIIGVVACMRYEFSIVLPKDDGEAANLLAVSLFLVMLVSLVSGIMVYFGNEWIIERVHDTALKAYLWLIPITVAINGIFLALNYWNSRTKHFGRQSVAEVLSSVTTQLTKLGAGFAGITSSGAMIAAGIIGQGTATAMLGRNIWGDDNKIFVASIKWKSMIAGFRKYSKFPKYDIWSGLLNAASWQLPTVLLAVFFNPVVVGYYALGLAVVRLPMNVVGKSVARVFYQRVSDAKNQGEVGNVVKNVYDRLVVIGLFPVMMLCLVGRDLFLVAFGKNWPEAGVYIQILAPFVFFNFISSPMSTLFSIYEKQEWSLYLNMVIFMTRLLSLFIGGILGNVYLALGLFSITGVIVYGGLSAWSIRMSGQSLKVFVLPLLRSCLIFLIAALGMLTLKILFKPTSVTYLLAAVAIAILYEAVVFLRDGTLMSYFKQMGGRKTVRQEGLA